MVAFRATTAGFQTLRETSGAIKRPIVARATRLALTRMAAPGASPAQARPGTSTTLPDTVPDSARRIASAARSSGN